MPLESERLNAYSEPDEDKTPAAGESSRKSAEDDWSWMVGTDPTQLLKETQPEQGTIGGSTLLQVNERGIVFSLPRRRRTRKVRLTTGRITEDAEQFRKGASSGL